LGKFKKASRGTPVAAARRAREFKTPNWAYIACPGDLVNTGQTFYNR
jgi:hypothetical protein